MILACSSDLAVALVAPGILFGAAALVWAFSKL